MILPILLFSLSLSGQSTQSIECSNFLDRRTEFHSNTDGLRIALQVHAADDHIKETHLCETDYSFLITRPDGTSTARELESIDDSWSRSIKFWIDGFASQGNRIIATIVERGQHSTFQVVVYDLKSERAADIYEIPRKFIEQSSSLCQESLKVIGITRLGDPIIAFRNGPHGCPTGAWKVKQGPVVDGEQKPSRPVSLPEHSATEPIERGVITSTE
jgi:hypothetical protein